MENKNIRPLFKYIGGKTWLKDNLREKINFVLEGTSLDTYVEPFSGGLGAFLAVYDILVKHGIQKIILNDINSPLIQVYESICNNKNDLLSAILELENLFIQSVPKEVKSLELNKKDEIKKLLMKAEIVFKNVRSEFNKNKGTLSIQQAARLVFLQKHSFNGVYRENLKGEYNTPFNWSGADMISTIETRIDEIHQILQLFEIQFTNVSYEKLNYSRNSLFYLDPPYANDAITENKYNQDHFDKAKQLDLLDKIKFVNFVYSNHYTDFIIAKLNDFQDIEIQQISRKNIMSASSESRKDDKLEVLATRKIS